jgi:hypothetical protein
MSHMKKRRSRTAINELLDYWIDVSKRSTLTTEDYACFFDRIGDSVDHFAEFYGWTRPSDVRFFRDRFFSRMESLLWLRNDLLKAATKRPQLSRNDYAKMKDVAKKFIPRIRNCFGEDIVVAVEAKTPLQDAEAILGQSNKLTYRWAAGIVVSNHIATLLIQLSRFRAGEKYKDDIRTLADNLKNRTTNRKLKTFLTRSHRRIEDADKLRNRCAHVIEGQPTKQEIEQSIAFARLLQKYISAASRGPFPSQHRNLS